MYFSNFEDLNDLGKQLKRQDQGLRNALVFLP